MEVKFIAIWSVLHWVLSPSSNLILVHNRDPLPLILTARSNPQVVFRKSEKIFGEGKENNLMVYWDKIFFKVALLNRKSYNLFKGAKLERKLPKVASLLIIYRDLERKEFLIYNTQKEKATVYLKPSTKSLNRKSSSWIFEFVTAFHLIKKTKLV